MKSREELIKEVESRNQIRAEAGLPLVSVEAEVKKIHKAEIEAAYWDWYHNHPLLSQFMAEALAKERERRNIPNWRPTLLNGSADINRYVEKKMRPLWEQIKDKTITW